MPTLCLSFLLSLLAVAASPRTLTTVMNHCPSSASISDSNQSNPPPPPPRPRTAAVEQVFSNRVNLCSNSNNPGPWSRLSVSAADAVTETLRSLGNMTQASKILDWGSGCGHRLHRFANEFGLEGIGVELSAPMVEWAHKHRHGDGRAFYCAGDGTDLSWMPDAHFDFSFSVGSVFFTAQDCRLVCSRDGMTCEPEHKTCSSTCKAVQEMVRVTKPGGAVVVDHLDLSFPMSSWATCLGGGGVGRGRGTLSLVTVPSHQLHEWNGTHWYGDTFYALIIGKRHEDGRQSHVVDRLATLVAQKHEWYTPTGVASKRRNVGMPQVAPPPLHPPIHTTHTTTTTSSAAPLPTAAHHSFDLLLDLNITGVDIPATNQSASPHRIQQLHDRRSVLVICHDLPGYWAQGAKDPDGGCGVDIVASWDVRHVKDAIVAELQGSSTQHRVLVSLHRSIRGPMASPGEENAAMEDPGTRFTDLPVNGDAKWSTGELPQPAYYEVRVSLRVDVVQEGTTPTTTTPTTTTTTTFAEKTTSAHFRVVRGSSVVPSPIVPVLVIGGGPNGLSVALSVGALLGSGNVADAAPVVVLEAGGDAGHFVKSWHDWTVPRSTSDTLASARATGCGTKAFKRSAGETFVTCSRSEYLQYLADITREGEAKGHIRFFPHSRVVSIRRNSEKVASSSSSSNVLSKTRDFFQVTATGGRVFRTSVVVVATGHYSVPRVLQVPGSTLPHVLTSKGLGRQDLHSRRVAKQVMVVGGGVSALEIANGMCEMGATVDLSYRGLHFTERWHHPSNKLLASLEKHVASKKLRLRMGTKVVWINQSHVGLRSAVGGGVNLDNRGPHIDPTTIFNNFTGDEIVLPAQSVIAAIGFDSDTSFFRDVARITLWSRSASGDGGTIQNGKPLLWQDGKLIKDKNNQWGESATKNLFVILTAGGVDGHVTKQHASNVNFEGCLGFFPAKQLSWKQVNVLPLSLAIARRVCEIKTDLL